jgi:class 3 adenylate cyclase/FixJ family two-component response regulator
MTTKILVVDDESDLELLIKQKFRRQIRENTYEFAFARNGVEALQKLQQQPDIDIVLSDINMPEMDGLTLLVKINEVSPVIKAVIVSAYGDMENIRTAMNRGAFDFICKPVNFMDLEVTMQKTIKYVNQLRQTLQAVKENNILKMYVDENVLKFMTHQEFETSLLANETIEATVAFFDICAFTTITENLPANTVVNLINEYFDLMVKEIIAQGGYIDKFIGDAIMAVFRGDYHIDRAVDAALATRAKMQAIQETVIEGVTYLPKISIGINTGEMVSGNIGSASLKRLDYTVIGDTVNIAQRIQSVAQPGQILVTEGLYNQIKESFSCELVGEVKLKNKAKAVVIYQVIE